MLRHRTFLIDTDLKAVRSSGRGLVAWKKEARKGEGERERDKEREPLRISRRIIASCFTLSDCITDTGEHIAENHGGRRGRLATGVASAAGGGLKKSQQREVRNKSRCPALRRERENFPRYNRCSFGAGHQRGKSLLNKRTAGFHTGLAATCENFLLPAVCTRRYESRLSDSTAPQFHSA